MYRRCGTSQVINLIDFRLVGQFHIVKHKLKTGISFQVGYVLFRTGEEIVQAYYFVPVFNQPGTQMRTYKAGTTANQYFFMQHLFLCPKTMQLVCSVYVLTNVGDLAKICKFTGNLFQLSRHIFRLVVRNTEIFIGKQVCQTRDLLQTKQLVPVHSYVFIIHWSDIPARSSSATMLHINSMLCAPRARL